MSDILNIALCFSGEPRYYERCIPSIQNLRNHPNVNLNVFYHLWDNITKRQKELREDPIIENINTKLIEDKIQPTYGIFESKDSLDPNIDEIFLYCKDLIEKYGINYNGRNIKRELRVMDVVVDKELLATQVKYTNNPWYSQIYSMCKAQMMRIQYEKENNMYYDFVLRSRTDVDLFFRDLNKLLEIKNHPVDGKSGPRTNIYFPALYIKGNRYLEEQIKHKGAICLPIHVEYCYFVGNSNTLSESVFKNYKQDILEYMLQVKGDIFYSKATSLVDGLGRTLDSVTEKDTTTIRSIHKATIFQPTSHTFIPYLLLKYQPDCELRSGLPSIKQKLKQMENLELSQ